MTLIASLLLLQLASADEHFDPIAVYGPSQSTSVESSERSSVVDLVPSPPPPSQPILPVLRLPLLTPREQGSAVALLSLALLSLWSASQLAVVRRRFLPTGVLPRALGTSQLLLRIVAFLSLLMASSAVIPTSIIPFLPYVLIGAALSIGWSIRDVLPDLIAGIAISMEDQIKPGYWIEGSHHKGTVEKIGFRAVWIRETTGRRVSIPNRFMLSTPLSDDQIHFPTLELQITMPQSMPTAEARALLLEMVLVSPWAAPGNPPILIPADDGAWRVRVRLLEGHFAEFFEGGLREHVKGLHLDRATVTERTFSTK